MALINHNELPSFLTAASTMLADSFTGFVYFTRNYAVTVNGFAALVTRVETKLPFNRCWLPQHLVKALSAFPSVTSLKVNCIDECVEIITGTEFRRTTATFTVEPPGTRVAYLSERLIDAAEEEADETLVSVSDLAKGYNAGGVVFLKDTLQPVLSALKTLNPMHKRDKTAFVSVIQAFGLSEGGKTNVLRVRSFSPSFPTVAIVMPAKE